MKAFAQPRDRSAAIGPRFDYLALAPAAAAICYPFLLRAFHAVAPTKSSGACFGSQSRSGHKPPAVPSR